MESWYSLYDNKLRLAEKFPSLNIKRSAMLRVKSVTEQMKEEELKREK